MRLGASPGASATLVLSSQGREEAARYVADRMPTAQLAESGPEPADDLRSSSDGQRVNTRPVRTNQSESWRRCSSPISWGRRRRRSNSGRSGSRCSTSTISGSAESLRATRATRRRRRETLRTCCRYRRTRSGARRNRRSLVSGTVRDLVAGSGIELEPRGVRDLKGIGPWPLYAVVEA
jgi:hypothetical protein